MPLYEGLCQVDIVQRMASILKPNGPWYIGLESGKFQADEVIPHDSPWVMVKPPGGLNCRRYYSILFHQFNGDIKQPPSRCQLCWKVVVRPKNISQLFKLYELQKSIAPMVYGCKCGVETRDYVNGLYGGYFYNRSLEEGKECLEMVKVAVAEKIGDVDVILKRGCTEYERYYGDSSKWALTDEQIAAENQILNHFEIPIEMPPQPQWVQLHIMRTWIEFACKHGDKDYLNHVGQPIHAEYVHY